MKEYALIFRTSPMGDFVPTQEQIQQMMTGWMNWMEDIRKKGNMAHEGSRLGIADSKTVKSGNIVTNGPYTEVKEFINGFIIVNEAVEIAKGCPVVIGNGGNVEVRPMVAPDDNS